MSYNLIEKAWIPVRRKSGKIERIAPWQIAEVEDPPIRIESPRPDFDAALLEFLIGLVQTVLTPDDSNAWEDIYLNGCAADLLKLKMLTVKDGFFLDADGPRFMQDLNVHLDPAKKENPIEGLLIDRGGADDSALFAKSGGFEEFSYPAAAAAILTLQIFAPSGGRGHCASLRGGGPLSVTIQGASLWGTVWCNVLIKSDLEGLPGDREKLDPPSRMPWMAETRTSEKGQPNTVPENIHPLQHFWSLPRRFRLDFLNPLEGTCAIYGDRNIPVVRKFFSRPDGTSYDGPFRHPLTPYTQGVDGAAPIPKKGSEAGLPYKDWPLLTFGSDTQLPPKVVDAFFQLERWRVADSHRIAARGYAMDQMKPIRFVEAEAPLLHVTPVVIIDLRSDLAGLIEASESVRKSLLKQVKAAWRDRGEPPGDVKSRVDTAFWAASESGFYAAVHGIAAALEGNLPSARAQEKIQFLGCIQKAAAGVFDALCPLDIDAGPTNLARAVRARQKLDRFTDYRSKVLLRFVGLAPAVEDDAVPKRKSIKRGIKL